MLGDPNLRAQYDLEERPVVKQRRELTAVKHIRTSAVCPSLSRLTLVPTLSWNGVSMKPHPCHHGIPDVRSQGALRTRFAPRFNPKSTRLNPIATPCNPLQRDLRSVARRAGSLLLSALLTHRTAKPPVPDHGGHSCHGALAGRERAHGGRAAGACDQDAAAQAGDSVSFLHSLGAGAGEA